jgi:hypothetical protein
VDALFIAASWCGVALLIIAHVLISLGTKKGFASRISATGAGISMAAALGMGIWSVFTLNVAWMAISIWGARIPERMTPSRYTDVGLVLLAAIGLPLWLLGAQVVAWCVSAIYVCGWLAFSMGAVTRTSYLAACVAAGISVVPVLWVLGAHAFAFNEAFGVLVGLYGIRRELVARVPVVEAAPSS